MSFEYAKMRNAETNQIKPSSDIERLFVSLLKSSPSDEYCQGVAFRWSCYTETDAGI